VGEGGHQAFRSTCRKSSSSPIWSKVCKDSVLDLSLLVGDTGCHFLRIAEEYFDQMVCVQCSKVRGTVDSDEIEDSIVLFLGKVGVKGECIRGVG